MTVTYNRLSMFAGILGLMAALIANVLEQRQLKSKREEFNAELSKADALWKQRKSEIDQKSVPEVIPFGEETLTRAMDAWRDATGVIIPRPRLAVAEKNTCGDAALACTILPRDLPKGQQSIIWFTRDWFTQEKQSSFYHTMLHEVGHLYGLDHMSASPMNIDGERTETISAEAADHVMYLHGLSAAQRAQKLQPKQESKPEHRQVAEGLQCQLDYRHKSDPNEKAIWMTSGGGGPYTSSQLLLWDKAGFVWDQPKDYKEIWDCRNKDEDLGGKLSGPWTMDKPGHWHRDKVTEDVIARKIAARDAFTKRKLIHDELALLPDIASPNWTDDHWSPWQTVFTSATGWCSTGVDCVGQYNCNNAEAESAALIGQLSFWNPPESELPLKLMLEYTKGLNCSGSGAQKAFDILNERIIDWLKKQ